MITKQLSVFLQNRPGHLAEITDILAREHIDIRAIDVTEGNEFGILRLITDDPYRAEHVLREEDYLVRLNSVLAIEPEDTPGSLAKIFRALTDDGLDIKYMYSIIQPVHNQKPTLIVKTSDSRRAAEVMEKIGVPVVRSKEVYEAHSFDMEEGDLQL